MGAIDWKNKIVKANENSEVDDSDEFLDGSMFVLNGGKCELMPALIPDEQ